MALKAVFFDAAGTLIKTARGVGRSYAALAQEYGVEVSPDEIARRFRACFASAPPLAFPGASLTEIALLERAWWEDLVRRVFEPWRPFPKFKAYFADLFFYFGRADSWSLYPDALPAIRALKERGMILQVVSNFDSRLVGILDGLELTCWFDAVTISSRAGYAKPSAEIFEAALKALRLRPEEALHVGDSFEKDVIGAQAAGVAAVWLDRSDGGTMGQEKRIRDLRELGDVVDRIVGPAAAR
jgi:putative hydrolase of the HAD superfamily